MPHAALFELSSDVGALAVRNMSAFSNARSQALAGVVLDK
jgi:hypothetical protein